MATIDKDGMLIDGKILLRRFPNIEHGTLSAASAIVVHQTDTTTAQQAFNSYTVGGNGAHFLIDENGLIYQTASVSNRCYHVGRLIRSKCLAIDKTKCDTTAMAKILAMSWTSQINAMDAHERAKSYPDRYPVNDDSLGIEIVGRHIDDKSYEAITPQQNASLQWLVRELYGLFHLGTGDVYKHPEVSYKHPGEAGTAAW